MIKEGRVLKCFAIAACVSLAALLFTQIQPVVAQSVDSRVGILVVAHGGGPAWDSQVMAAVAPLADECMVEVGFLLALGGSPSVGDAYGRLVARGAREVIVLPLMISSHSSHYDQILYVFGELDELRPPAGVEPYHTPQRVALTVPVSAVLPALDSHPMVAPMIEARLRESAPAGGRFSFVLVAHGPNADEDAERWLEHMGRVASQAAENLPVDEHACLLVRDDAAPEVRERAVSSIRQTVSGMAGRGRAYVLPHLIGRGHLSDEIREMVDGVGCEFVDFCFVEAPSLHQYLKSRVAEYLNDR